MGSFAFALAGDGTETLELDIYAVIGQSFWFDSVSANYVRRRLKENAKAKLIKLRIHSDGGDTFDAQAIYSDLQAHGARVEADITGLAASAATLIAMAADKIRITEGAWFMIHNPWGCACGGPEQLEDWAEVLRKSAGVLADIYARRSGLDRKKVVQLMDAETWMTATEAKAFGFVDEVVPAKAKASASALLEKRAVNSVRQSVAFSMASGDYSNLPELLRTELELQLERESKAKKKPPDEGGAPAEADVEEPTPPPPVAAPPQPQLQLALGQGPAAEETSEMTIPKSILQALGLSDDADEAAVVAAINKNKASARVGASIEALIGVSGEGAVGAVRALKETNEANAKLGDEVEKLKVVNARRDFENLREQGLKDKKLSPAQAKFYADMFESAVKPDENGIPAGDGSNVVAQLRGFLAVSHRQSATVVVQQPTPNSDVSTPVAGSATHNGKAFEQMTPGERLKLKRENPDLYTTVREDAQARGVL